MNALEFNAVTKSFGHQRVLEHVSFALARGEALGLIGVNGAGKTTLLRALLDLARADSGTISVFGTPSIDLRARAHLSYLAERFNPPGFVTGHELLRYLLALHRQPLVAADADAEAEALALDLEPAVLARPLREYSKGMTQKLGLIACILARRALLVLDEPMSGLDPRARAAFKGRLAEQKALGTTLFFSTHLLADVEALCDRIAILNQARLVFLGTPAVFLARYGADNLEQAFLKSLVTPV